MVLCSSTSLYLDWLTPPLWAVGTTVMLRGGCGHAWTMSEGPQVRWMMANGANSECILRESLVLQSLGADSFQQRQAPTCSVFLPFQAVVTFRAHRKPMFKKTIFNSQSKASSFPSKHHDLRRTTVVTPAAVTGDNRRMNNKWTLIRAFFVSNYQNAQTFKMSKN